MQTSLKKKCKDTIEDPVMGTCYCVCIGDLEKSDFVGKAEASYRNVEHGYRGRYLPLKAWGAKGYDTDKIL